MEGDTVWVSDKKQESNFLIFIKKYAIIIIDIAIVLVIATIFIVRALKSSTLDILIAPTTATVKINGETYPSSGSFNFSPGTYEVEILADGFESKTLSIDVLPNSIQKIYVYLTGKDDNFLPYDGLNLAEVDILRTINDDNPHLVAYLEKIDQYSDFISSLPYGYSDESGALCSIGINQGNYKNLIVTRVHLCEPEVIESWLKSKNLDPSYFQITYQDLPEAEYDD